MPWPTAWASESTVIQSPASRAARRSELPGPLRVVGERPLEEAEGEPARLERAARGRGGRRRRAAARRGRRRVASRKPRLTAAISGQRTPMDVGRCPGAIRCWPSRYSGSASAREARPERGGERLRVVDEVRQARAEAPRRRPRGASTNATARRGRRADGAARRSRVGAAVAVGASTGPGVAHPSRGARAAR